ncbi:hypothetical protein [Streptomyces sp. NBC_00057]|uniref:hypothetical protein n=1 Tax=Streptomyces sp. NBC_00057 TaxID=2975634 RepID=UPI0032457C97
MEPPPDPPSSPPRTAFAGAGSDHPAHPGHSLLRHRPFALLCGEQIASSVGRQVATLALALLAVTRLDAGPFGASALMALSYLPGALLGPFAGVLVDRARLRGLTAPRHPRARSSRLAVGDGVRRVQRRDRPGRAAGRPVRRHHRAGPGDPDLRGWAAFAIFLVPAASLGFGFPALLSYQFLFGLSATVWALSMTTTQQLITPPELQGRVAGVSRPHSSVRCRSAHSAAARSPAGWVPVITGGATVALLAAACLWLP